MTKLGRLIIISFTVVPAIMIACKPKANTSPGLRDSEASCRSDADLAKIYKDRDQAIKDLQSRNYDTSGLDSSQPAQTKNTPPTNESDDGSFGLAEQNCDDVNRTKSRNCAAAECLKRNQDNFYNNWISKEDCNSQTLPISAACAKEGGVAYDMCIQQNKANANNASTTLCCSYKMDPVNKAYTYNWMSQEEAAKSGFAIVANSCRTIAAGGRATNLTVDSCRLLAGGTNNDQGTKPSRNTDSSEKNRQADITRFKANYDRAIASISTCQKQIADYKAKQDKLKTDKEKQKAEEDKKRADEAAKADQNGPMCTNNISGWKRDDKGICINTNGECPQAQWTKGVDGVCRPYYKCKAGEALDGWFNCVKVDPSKTKVTCKDDEYPSGDGLTCYKKDAWDDKLGDSGFIDKDGDGIPDVNDRCPNSPKGKTVWTSGEWIGCAEGESRTK